MKNKKRGSAWIWIVIILIVIALGIGLYFLFGGAESVANGLGSSIPQPPALPD
ncbi:MAG: hypothetical protein ABIB79_00290 [archaeon]